MAGLRKKVEHDPDRSMLINTVRGVGYTFTAEVERRGPAKR
jgi:DNA-binding response OmpR family regulator